MKTHRVGTTTFGSILVILGIVLLLQLFIPGLDYTIILDFWPVTLILLGIEILVANARSNTVQFQYDGWSIVLMFLTLGFTCCMGIADYILAHMPQYL